MFKSLAGANNIFIIIVLLENVFCSDNCERSSESEDDQSISDTESIISKNHENEFCDSNGEENDQQENKNHQKSRYKKVIKNRTSMNIDKERVPKMNIERLLNLLCKKQEEVEGRILRKLADSKKESKAKNEKIERHLKQMSDNFSKVLKFHKKQLEDLRDKIKKYAMDSIESKEEILRTFEEKRAVEETARQLEKLEQDKESIQRNQEESEFKILNSEDMRKQIKMLRKTQSESEGRLHDELKKFNVETLQQMKIMEIEKQKQASDLKQTQSILKKIESEDFGKQIELIREAHAESVKREYDEFDQFKAEKVKEMKIREGDKKRDAEIVKETRVLLKEQLANDLEKQIQLLIKSQNESESRIMKKIESLEVENMREKSIRTSEKEKEQDDLRRKLNEIGTTEVSSHDRAIYVALQSSIENLIRNRAYKNIHHIF